MSLFKALMVKRLRQIPSDGELYRRLWDDPILREICNIEDRESPYHPYQLTRFRRRVVHASDKEKAREMLRVPEKYDQIYTIALGYLDGEKPAMPKRKMDVINYI